LSSSKTKDSVEIRIARKDDVKDICAVLCASFELYRHHYTERAYRATVSSLHEMEKRIDDSKAVVLVAIYKNEIAGTASVRIRNNDDLHIRSMAVKPNCQGKGIGWLILERISELAKQRRCRTISLECFEPLTKAVALYNACGFSRTSKTRKYHGITVFEMKKNVHT